MSRPKVTFNVVGRYMDGSKVVGYQLIDRDGSQLRVNVERVIFMIGRGEIDNMRIQYVNGIVVPRGKGVNLQKLPVFDIKKQQLRCKTNQKTTDNVHIIQKQLNQSEQQNQTQIKNNDNKSINNSIDYSTIGQQKIIARILKENKVEGYVVQDFSGQIKKLPKSEVIRLASNKIISNAEVLKTNPYHGLTLEKAKLQTNFNLHDWEYIQKWGYITVLQGIGIQLDKLPSWIILPGGNIINVQERENALKTQFRAFRVPRGGTIYNINTGKHKQFKSGDYIAFLQNGELDVISVNEFNTMFKVKHNTIQDCDWCIDRIQDFEVEVFGSHKQKISKAQISTWPIYGV